MSSCARRNPGSLGSCVRRSSRNLAEGLSARRTAGGAKKKHRPRLGGRGDERGGRGGRCASAVLHRTSRIDGSVL